MGVVEMALKLSLACEILISGTKAAGKREITILRAHGNIWSANISMSDSMLWFEYYERLCDVLRRKFLGARKISG